MLINMDLMSTTIVATPKQVSLRRSVLLKEVTNTGSPMRRLNNLVKQTPTTEHLVDDDQERNVRRSHAEIIKRISSIGAQSPFATNESEMKAHLQTCLKMHAENKINMKNVWNLKIIDYMRTLFSSKGQASESLHVAGTSLDAGSKIYGIRVDDIHSDGLKLASNMARVDAQRDTDANDDDDEKDEAIEGDKGGSKKKKKPKRRLGGPKMTVAKDPKTLLGSIPKMESVFFQTRVDLTASSTDNLFTNKLPTHFLGHKFMLLSEEPAWHSYNEETNVNLKKAFPLVIKKLTKIQICPQFSNFEIDDWDPDNEKETLNEHHTVTDEVVFDSQGIPIPELDGSYQDLFAQIEGENHYCSSEEEDINGIGLIGRNKTITAVVDFNTDGAVCGDDYSFSKSVTLMGNKRLTQVWAGPSHWKLKYIKPSVSRFSGQQEKQAVKSARKPKVQPIFIDFYNDDYPIDRRKRYNSKRKVGDPDPYKCTLPPVPLMQNMKNSPLMLKPLHIQNKIKKVQDNIIDNEVQPYNYENPNDSQYCGQNGFSDHNSENEEMPPVLQQKFLGDNLIDAPEEVPHTYIPYAVQAKKMDMKKLKTAIWKIVVSQNIDEVVPDKNMYKRDVQNMTFSDVYKNLPSKLSENMRQELSRPLVFVALLHLANEQNLCFEGQSDLKDFKITQLSHFSPN
ncbi:hypothetical protein FQA39_LY17335 [Lamprigera yunnana]|nr:hypothetical protein FQA39_LY17335 [Lamprigera yunnana]